MNQHTFTTFTMLNSQKISKAHRWWLESFRTTRIRIPILPTLSCWNRIIEWFTLSLTMNMPCRRRIWFGRHCFIQNPIRVILTMIPNKYRALAFYTYSACGKIRLRFLYDWSEVFWPGYCSPTNPTITFCLTGWAHRAMTIEDTPHFSSTFGFVPYWSTTTMPLQTFLRR